ncbi:hypothetical protein BX616_004816 [Lobosporangium transversale]|nr:hypothetical protein BX616_004816 [Lobosporangium transversale]
MGHKRKKFSERVAERNARGFNESPFKNAASDTPKAFSRIMFKKESIEKKREEQKRNNKSVSSTDHGRTKTGANHNSNKLNDKENGKKHSTEELRIKPNEKMSEFSRRVDEFMRDKLMKATMDNTSKGSKKKK